MIFNKKKKIYITGARGFIGSNLVESLLKDKHNVVVWDGGDICNGIKIENDFDIIYHLAANSDTRFQDDVDMYKNNVGSFLEVLKFTLKNKKTKLIYASSAAIYGNKTNKPINSYAGSKMICDEIAKHYFNKMTIIGLRPFNVYGKGELGKGNMASTITQWRTQVQNGERPKIFDGDFKRDFIYVKDVVRGMKEATKLKSGIYDLGTGVATDFFDVLKIVLKTLGSHTEPIVIPNPYLGKYQEYTKADTSWGFKPDYTVESGIKDYFENYD